VWETFGRGGKGSVCLFLLNHSISACFLLALFYSSPLSAYLFVSPTVPSRKEKRERDRERGLCRHDLDTLPTLRIPLHPIISSVAHLKAK
jgi:hypothetical protein